MTRDTRAAWRAIGRIAMLAAPYAGLGFCARALGGLAGGILWLARTHLVGAPILQQAVAGALLEGGADVSARDARSRSVVEVARY